MKEGFDKRDRLLGTTSDYDGMDDRDKADMISCRVESMEENESRRPKKDDGSAPPPEQSTEAARRFFEAHFRMYGFLSFVYGLAKRADELAKMATEVLHDEAVDPEGTQLRKELDQVKEKGALTAFGRYYRRLVTELVVTRIADNYLTYLAELLALIFTVRPETLKSNETMRVEEMLKHPSMEELIAEIAERRVVDLSHEDMEDLATYLEDRLGLKLFNDPDDLRRAVQIAKVRNLIVHNRGIVNRTYRRRVPEDVTPLGEQVNLRGGQVLDNAEFLAESVVDLDSRAIEKYGLPVVRERSGTA